MSDTREFVKGLKAFIQNVVKHEHAEYDAANKINDSRKQEEFIFMKGYIAGLRGSIGLIDDYMNEERGWTDIKTQNEQKDTIDDIFVKKFMDKVIMSETKGYR